MYFKNKHKIQLLQVHFKYKIHLCILNTCIWNNAQHCVGEIHACPTRPYKSVCCTSPTRFWRLCVCVRACVSRLFHQECGTPRTKLELLQKRALRIIYGGSHFNSDSYASYCAELGTETLLVRRDLIARRFFSSDSRANQLLASSNTSQTHMFTNCET